VAAEYGSYDAMLAGQGLEGPAIRAQLLPTVADPVDADRMTALEADLLGVARLPLVLSVSSIEPRKNHMRMLEAAERLWREGHAFQLLFIGGSGWKNDAVMRTIEQLQRRGRPVRLLSKADDETLWAAYRLARCSLFVSLVEGFGLPAAESLAVGTPVVITNYGSMAEIAVDGGTIPVDPRDPDAIATALRTMLTDDDEYERLRSEALARPMTSWDGYAEATWSWLVEGRDSG
jgi:glycosyltransferase involved in cell wall biosynthesis